MLTDEDNLNDVLISVQYGLKHGRLEISGSRSMFSVADLNDGNVRYTHDDTDTLTDNIIFKASDGRNEVNFNFNQILLYSVKMVDINVNHLIPAFGSIILLLYHY